MIAKCLSLAGPAAAIAAMLIGAISRGTNSPPEVAFRDDPGRVVIIVGDRPVAAYVFADREILRPYFAHVCAPGGIQLTRNHPPVETQDRTDHAANHPGIWLAFGDISGQDFWRNKGRVIHERFVEKPAGGAGEGRFAAENRYVAAGGESTVCREIARYTFLVRPEGYLLLWDSTFSADEPFSFGDQEEMGLGLRVATPLAVDSGGTILDAEERKNGSEVWGQASAWCDYSGTIEGRHAGLAIFCHPANFRPSWFHARDYGLLVANPFGRRAFGKGDASQVVVKPGETLRLRYGVLVHIGPEGSRPDLMAAYADFVKLAGPYEEGTAETRKPQSEDAQLQGLPVGRVLLQENPP